MINITDKYKSNIHGIYTDLIHSGKKDIDMTNNDLCKIFEYYSCIMLYEELGQVFYEYNDIDPTFKEENKMTKNDTGIDACNLIDTIVQCKLRQDTLSWRECATFFACQNQFDETIKKKIIRWDNLIITRNSDSTLTKNLKARQDLFIDKHYNRDELINYCKTIKPIKIPTQKTKIELRDYQNDCIKLINESKNNVVISLPTGTGKNIIMINAMNFKMKLKYLVLVPRIILMEQLQSEIIKYKPTFKNDIQLIGNNNVNFDINKCITICVFNSIGMIEKHCGIFEKIFIDEAHHIYKPEIYVINDEIVDNSSEEMDEIDENVEDKIEDDTEDEMVNTDTYIKIICGLKRYNNNVYLSATIDRIDGFEYYKKEIREMIDNKYLCDYTINIPIFNDNPNNDDICKYLLKNYRNIIVYCNTRAEGIKFNTLLNNLQKGMSDYIDYKTTTSKRNIIIKRYKEGLIPFLINVRILVEGFDAPITQGVCFIHMPSSKTTLIQIIGRALRLHPMKTIANIILPFSTREDEKSISNFMRIIANNDSRIRKSYENKKLGGYISIENAVNVEPEKDQDSDQSDEDVNGEENMIEFRYNLIYDSMGTLQNGVDVWMKKLEEIKKYIDRNGKFPSKKDKVITTRILGEWICMQRQNYKNKVHCMKTVEIYDAWSGFINDANYNKYVVNHIDEWKCNLNKCKLYMDQYNKSPSKTDKLKTVSVLGEWICTQKINYKNKTGTMKSDEVVNLWLQFINDDKYKHYFISNEDMWQLRFQQVRTYIDINNKLPLDTDVDSELKSMSNWIGTQKKIYKSKSEIMKNQNIYNTWTNFINDDKYKQYFISYETVWKNRLDEIKIYMDETNTRPSSRSKDATIKSMGSWLVAQSSNFKSKSRIMKNAEISNAWVEFICDKKYKKYF